MLTTLSAKNKSQFVNGSAKKPEKENSLFNAWQRCNDMVVSWIVHSVSSNIRQSILWMENVEDIAHIRSSNRGWPIEAKRLKRK